LGQKAHIKRQKVSSKRAPSSMKKAHTSKKAKQQRKKRTVLLFSITILLVMIYGVFTEEIKIVPSTVQETTKTFLLFGGFYSFLIGVGYILGRRSKR
jgi:uncharacterized ion transporter superfamily protein YfcC